MSSNSAVIRWKPTTNQEGVELWGKDADTILRPGSMTKLLTAYVGLNWLKKLDAQDIEFKCEAQDVTGGSGNNLLPGDVLDLENALANMGLPSSNVTAAVWARTCGKLMLSYEGKTGGAKARFIAEMNSVSAALGMHNSKWGNVSGLDGGNNMSTARDLGLLCEIADQRHPEVSRIWSCPAWQLRITGPNARTVAIEHSAKFIREGASPVTWGKTGTTRASGCSLLCEVKGPKGNRYYYVGFGASSNAGRYADAHAVFGAAQNGIRWPDLPSALPNSTVSGSGG